MRIAASAADIAEGIVVDQDQEELWLRCLNICFRQLLLSVSSCLSDRYVVSSDLLLFRGERQSVERGNESRNREEEEEIA